MTEPTVAVILKGYPRLSETFIAQELHGLEQKGFAFDIWSLRHPTDGQEHPVHGLIKARRRYLPEYLRSEPLPRSEGHRLSNLETKLLAGGVDLVARSHPRARPESHPPISGKPLCSHENCRRKRSFSTPIFFTRQRPSPGTLPSCAASLGAFQRMPRTFGRPASGKSAKRSRTALLASPAHATARKRCKPWPIPPTR